MPHPWSIIGPGTTWGRMYLVDSLRTGEGSWLLKKKFLSETNKAKNYIKSSLKLMKQSCRFVSKPNKYSLLRGALKTCYWKNLGFCPKQVDPPSPPPRPPPSLEVETPKKNEAFLHFRLLWSILFFFSYFHHIYWQFQGKFSLGKKCKQIGIGRPPPPWLGQNPKFFH